MRSNAHRYRIALSDLHGHVLSVTLTIAQPAAEGQCLALPAWIPGSYMIREFARHVQTVSARDARGALRIEKVDKHTWRTAPARGPLVVEYSVYAWDLSVRAAHIDATHAFINPSSVCLRVVGQEDLPCEVELLPPPAEVATGWKVATTLPEAGVRRGRFGRYRAADYDALIDHPIEMGRFASVNFEVAGVPHRLVVTGAPDADLERIAADLTRVCTAQVRLFEPQSEAAPFERYLFLVTALGEGYGGLEHRDSTALLCARSDLPARGVAQAPEGYRNFLGLASHEYFHAWHVKRIKPAAFVRYDLDREVYTRLLWIFEGFTSYYDDLMLVRAGLISPQDYLTLLARTISQVERGPGQRMQSVAESSFDAWIKYYRQDENSPNAIVSYYAKGALVALAIDLSLRARTDGRRSLDDVMRRLWADYGRDFYRPGAVQKGLAEDAFPALLHAATGVDLDASLRRWVEGTEALPLARLLKPMGVSLNLAAADPLPSLGAKLVTRGADLCLATAYRGGAAHRAGLSAGDVLVAIDGLRIDERSLKTLLARRAAGDRIEVHAFRRDVLSVCTLELDAPPATEARLTLADAPPRALRDWLS